MPHDFDDQRNHLVRGVYPVRAGDIHSAGLYGLEDEMSELKECLEHGAGTCRNADMIDQLRAELGELWEDICNYQAELARRDEIIARLKEDAERLAVVNGYYCCNQHENYLCHLIDVDTHAPDCPITLHRALMKELE